MKKFLVPSLIVLIILASCIKEKEEKTIVKPVVTIYTATNQTDTSCEFYGEVLRRGTNPIQMQGFCWDTDSLPTVSNFKSENGSDVGTFSTVATSLQPQTQYHIRAYAQTSAGIYYSERSEKFTTN